MKQTLAELITEAENGNVRPVIEYLSESLKSSDEKKLVDLSAQFKQVLESQGSIREAIERLIAKPEKEYPEPKDVEFPETQKVSGEVIVSNLPEFDYAGWTKMLIAALKPLVLSITEAIREEGEKTRQMMSDMDAEDEAEEKPEEKPSTVNTAALRSRRTTQWKIATYPQVAGTLGLVSAGDGLTYYLPSAIIPNSETIRLNGGLPLSHGVDYTISGNKIVYSLDQTNSQQEIRYQTK